jgi:radical SAM superfamily enzyme
MYDVILFTDETNSMTSMPPIGAYKLAMVLRQCGYEVLVVNLFSYFNEQDFDELIEQTVSSRTKLIGFSTTFLKSVNIEVKEGEPSPPLPELELNCVFPQGKEFENIIIDKFRRRNPDIKFCAGGVKVTEHYGNKNIDYVVLGYAESSILTIVEHLIHNKPLQYSRRNIHGLIVVDDRMAKDYDFVNEKNMWLPEDIVNFKTLSMEIARGCIFKCKFCSYPMNGKHNLDFVRAEQYLQYELERNYELYGITQYQLVDDTFNDHVDKLARLEKVISKLPFQPTFWTTIRLDLVATRLHTIKMLHNIGVKAMSFGIESMKPSTAKIIGKGFDRERQNEALRIFATDYPDISLHGLFITGLPEETPEELTDTMNNITSGEVPLDSWHFQPLAIATNKHYLYQSDIEKNYQQYGYEKIGNWRNYIIWKNDIWDFESCADFTTKFMNESKLSKRFRVSGIDSLNISGMGDPKHTFDSIRRTSLRDFNWHDIEHRVRKNFLQDYKTKLFKLIDV